MTRNGDWKRVVTAGVGVAGVLTAAPAVAAEELFAYIGPGAGLGMLGALFAVLAFVALALLGPILYPIRLIRRRMRQRAAAEQPVTEKSPGGNSTEHEVN